MALPVHYSSAALEGGNVTAGRARIDNVICTNTSAGTLYLQVFDSATLPADTTVPKVCIAVPATSSVAFDPQGTSLSVSDGIAFCLSSTAATKTIAGSVGFFTVFGSAK